MVFLQRLDIASLAHMAKVHKDLQTVARLVLGEGLKYFCVILKDCYIISLFLRGRV